MIAILKPFNFVGCYSSLRFTYTHTHTHTYTHAHTHTPVQSENLLARHPQNFSKNA